MAIRETQMANRKNPIPREHEDAIDDLLAGYSEDWWKPAGLAIVDVLMPILGPEKTGQIILPMFEAMVKANWQPGANGREHVRALWRGMAS